MSVPCHISCFLVCVPVCVLWLIVSGFKSVASSTRPNRCFLCELIVYADHLLLLFQSMKSTTGELGPMRDVTNVGTIYLFICLLRLKCTCFVLYLVWPYSTYITLPYCTFLALSFHYHRFLALPKFLLYLTWFRSIICLPCFPQFLFIICPALPCITFTVLPCHARRQVLCDLVCRDFRKLWLCMQFNYRTAIYSIAQFGSTQKKPLQSIAFIWSELIIPCLLRTVAVNYTIKPVLPPYHPPARSPTLGQVTCTGQDWKSLIWANFPSIFFHETWRPEFLKAVVGQMRHCCW